MRTTRRRFLGAAIGAGVVLPTIDLGGIAAAEPAAAPPFRPPTVDELYTPPDLLDTALSPNGEFIATLRELREGGSSPNSHKASSGPDDDRDRFVGTYKTEIPEESVVRRTAYVAMRPSDQPDAKPSYVRIGDYDVEQVEWANDKRLLVWVSMKKNAAGATHGLTYRRTFFPIPVRRVLSVGVNGERPLVLLTTSNSGLRRAYDLGNVVDLLANDDDHIIMQNWDGEAGAYALQRVNVVTGVAVQIETGERATDGWFLQDGVPVLRFDSNSRGTTFSIFGRAPGETEWRLIRKTRRNELKRITSFDVVGSTREPGVLLVSFRGPDEQFASIRTFDVRTLKMGEIVKSRPDADLTAIKTDDQDGLIAVSWKTDRQQYDFEDPALAAHFRRLNETYGDKANIRIYDASRDHKRLLLHVTGPQIPGKFAYYDVAREKLDLLGDRFEHLAPERLAQMETLKVTCRDGAQITAFLSHPVNVSGPAPLVVLPHGGPEVRDYFDYNPWVQALCAYGWRVLQPNFRGSGGYGRAFGDAGRKRWGTGMQEDVEDAVSQMVKAGLADASKLAILGASYGGYAAMMGIVRQPDLYRCAVAISGDFDLLQSLAFTEKEDGSDSEAYAYWTASMGNPATDRDLLKAHSPRQRVKEIKVPVLMMHGSEDTIVSPDQSRRMAKALKSAGKAYDYVEFPGEGHSGWSKENEIKMLGLAIGHISRAFT